MTACAAPDKHTSRIETALLVLAVAAVVAGLIPLAAPLWPDGFMLGHDGGVHPWYALLFDRALRQGQLPVRWVEGAEHGLGQPLFNYYQVGFYYLVSLVHAVGPSLSAAFKLVVVEQWALGALFMFLLCRPLGTLPAALGAAVYLWSPYLLLDAYVRNAYPEFAAIGFVPGVLWAIDRSLRTGRVPFVCATALFTAWLLISHLPTAVIIAPVAAVYVASVTVTHRPRWQHVARTVGGALLGAGLASFYIVPAILEIGEVRIQRMTAGYFDFHKHFVQPRWWVDWSWGYAGSGIGAPDQMSMQIGIVQWIVIGAALVALAVPAWRGRLRVRPLAIVALLAGIGVSLFLMTRPSLWIWDSIGPMAFIQFPWRLLMVPTILCAMLAAYLASAFESHIVGALLVIAVVGGQWYATEPYRTMASERARETMLIDDPQWASSDAAKRLAFREASYDPLSVAALPAPTGERWAIPTDAPIDVTPTRTADTDLTLNVRAGTATTLVINTPMFPGWGVNVDGRRARPAIQPRTGYMALPLAAGTHVVRATFGRDGVRTTADIVTVFSGLIWLALLLAPSAAATGRPTHP